MKRTLAALIAVLFFSCFQSNKKGHYQGSANIDSVLTKQVLLTNNADFKEGGVHGANSFFINYNNSEI